MTNQAFQRRIFNSRTWKNAYLFVWWITCPPKFLPTIQFHPFPLLSIYVFRYFAITLSCLFSLMLSFKDSSTNYITLEIYSWSISVALIIGLESGIAAISLYELKYYVTNRVLNKTNLYKFWIYQKYMNMQTKLINN